MNEYIKVLESIAQEEYGQTLRKHKVLSNKELSTMQSLEGIITTMNQYIVQKIDEGHFQELEDEKFSREFNVDLTDYARDIDGEIYVTEHIGLLLDVTDLRVWGTVKLIEIENDFPEQISKEDIITEIKRNNEDPFGYEFQEEANRKINFNPTKTKNPFSLPSITRELLELRLEEKHYTALKKSDMGILKALNETHYEYSNYLLQFDEIPAPTITITQEEMKEVIFGADFTYEQYFKSLLATNEEVPDYFSVYRTINYYEGTFKQLNKNLEDVCIVQRVEPLYGTGRENHQQIIGYAFTVETKNPYPRFISTQQLRTKPQTEIERLRFNFDLFPPTPDSISEFETVYTKKRILAAKLFLDDEFTPNIDLLI